MSVSSWGYDLFYFNKSKDEKPEHPVSSEYDCYISYPLGGLFHLAVHYLFSFKVACMDVFLMVPVLSPCFQSLSHSKIMLQLNSWMETTNMMQENMACR